MGCKYSTPVTCTHPRVVSRLGVQIYQGFKRLHEEGKKTPVCIAHCLQVKWIHYEVLDLAERSDINEMLSKCLPHTLQENMSHTLQKKRIDR